MPLDREKVKAKRRKAWSRFLEDRSEQRQVELVETYRPMIEYMAWHDYGQRRDLEDVADAGMMGILEATEKIDVKKVKSVDAYVAMVARSRMINYMQKMWNRDMTMDDYSIMQIMEKALEQNIQLVLEVDEQIEHLTPKEQLILRLRFWEDWQLKDIASHLGISVQRLRFHEQRAFDKLSARMKT